MFDHENNSIEKQKNSEFQLFALSTLPSILSATTQKIKRMHTAKIITTNKIRRVGTQDNKCNEQKYMR